jgi:Fur family transcriptional regulator, zinc uptake regulator
MTMRLAKTRQKSRTSATATVATIHSLWQALEPSLGHDVRSELARAKCHIEARSGQFTALRQLVMAALSESRTPLGAYDIMQRLGTWLERPIAPPTVYRAIDYLIEQGLVTRVTSRNAFVLCAHAGHPHDCVFFICEHCGKAEEVEDDRLDTLIAADASAIGFTPTRRTLEVAGTCRDCQPAAGG